MGHAEILELMKRYFVGKQPADVLATFPEQQPRALLKESLDVVDFVVFLEDELGREIDISSLGEALYNKNFEALSVEVSEMLAA